MQYRDSLEGNGQFLASRTTEVFYPTVPIKTFIVTNGIIIKKKKKTLVLQKICMAV